MERKTRNEVILAGRESGEADASNANEPRFLWNDLHVAERTQHVDESPGKLDDRWIRASKESLECEPSTRMRQILRDEARTALWADPQRGFRGWHGRSLPMTVSSSQLPAQ